MNVRAEAQRCEINRVELHGLVKKPLAAIRGAGLTVVITSVLEETADVHKAMVQEVA
jgi:hypothetical protein